MDEATAYSWAAQCLRPVDGRIESHLVAQVADKIVSALVEATTSEHKRAEQLKAQVAQLTQERDAARSIAQQYFREHASEADEICGCPICDQLREDQGDA